MFRKKEAFIYIWIRFGHTSYHFHREKIAIFRTLLYAIFEHEFLGPLFPYFCNLNVSGQTQPWIQVSAKSEVWQCQSGAHMLTQINQLST